MSSYSGPYGSVPQHADPVDGELLANKGTIDMWMDLVHTAYPSGDVTTYRRALVELADVPSYEGGRKVDGLLALGSVDHGLSNEQGSFAAAASTIKYADAKDRLVRDLLEQEDLEYDEVRIKLASPDARAASLPPRIVCRGVVQNAQLTNPLEADLAIVDPLFADFGPFGPNRQWPALIPQIVGMTTPADVLALPMPWVYGEKSDEGATDPATNTLISKGLWPLAYLGQETFTRTVMPPPTPPTSAITLDATIPFAGTNYVVNSADERPTLYDPTVTLGDHAHPVYLWIVVMKGTTGNIAVSAYGDTFFNTQGWTPEGSTDAYGVYTNWIGVSDPLNEVTGYRVYVADAPDFNPLGSPGSATKARYKEHDTTTFNGDYPWSSFSRNFLNWTEGTDALTGSTTPTDPVEVSDVWDVYLVAAHPTFRILGVYGSNLQDGNTENTADRIKLDPDSRSDLLVPGFSAWPFADTFRSYTGTDGTTYDWTVIYAKGPLSDAHKNGSINLCVNLVGVEDVGDGTGLPLIDAMACWQHWLENPILNDWTSGPWCQDGSPATAPIWEDGTYKVRSSAFADRQTFLASSYGGRGLTVGWGVDKQQSVDAWNAEWIRSTETRIGTNGHWQLTVWGVDETQDPTDWPRIDHVTDIFGQVQTLSGQERQNVVSGACDWDADASRFRAGPITFTSTAGVLKYKGHKKQGDQPLDSTILNDATQFAWVLQRRLTRLQFGARLITLQGPVRYLDYDVGTGILLNTIEGTAAGYADRPCIILRRALDIPTWITTYTLLDVRDLLWTTAIPGGLESTLGPLDDETGSPAPRMLGDEEAVPSTALVLT